MMFSKAPSIKEQISDATKHWATKKQRFQVGNTSNLKDDDPFYDDFDFACKKARSKSVTEGSPVAIWDEEGDCITIFYQGLRFNKVE